MLIKKAEGSHFRNYKSFSVDFKNPLSVFTGKNGEGKSSFLEAIYCALKGKSFHPFIRSEFIQNKQTEAKVRLTLEEEEGPSFLESSFCLGPEGLKKSFSYCGKKTSPLYLSRKIPAFVFTEESMKSIRQGPDQRRAFIDEMFYSESEKKAKRDFYKILIQKKRLLKSIKQGKLSVKEGEKHLSVLNIKFLQLSHIFVKKRLELLKALFSDLDLVKGDFFKEPKLDLAFSYYISQQKYSKKTSSLLFYWMEEDLKKKKELEIQTGSLLSGPQRHDIRFLFNGEDSRTFCSKGEQRALILSLLAARVKSFSKGLLFLDDVLMELDETKQEQLLYFLTKNHCQSLLTSCKFISFKSKNMSFFSVKNGTIKAYD